MVETQDEQLIGILWYRSEISASCGTLTLDSLVLCAFTEDIPAVGTDVDIQLLDAAKAGDLELVRVSQLI